MRSRIEKWLYGPMTACLIATGATHVAAQAPGMPASPLAGGMAAADGGQFVDAHGNSVVMPASYCDPGGMCCDPMACSNGGGDGGYVDYGGYSSPDQCGPHYFDVSAQAIFLQSERVFDSTPAFGSVGVAGPQILDPGQSLDKYNAGWQIAARYDLGPLSVLEATYFGIYDIGFRDTVNSVDVAPGNVDFQLNSVFSDYGINPIDGLDQGQTYTLDYQADLQSTELSYRRYWVGYNPRISGTYLLGARYLRFTEDLAFSAVALDGVSNLNWGGSNDLVGFQFGGDGWIQLRQGLRFGGEAKSGIYNNRYEFSRNATIDGQSSGVSANGNQVAFAAEGSADLVADILPSWSLRGGYRVLYMSSLTTVGNNVSNTLTSSVIDTQADALFHGFHVGVEYIW